MSKIFTLLFSTILTFGSFSFCTAQSSILDNKDSLKYYLNKSEFEIDKNADAVIIYESGISLLSDYVMTYTVERTIKILNQNALSQIGMVAIPANSNTTIKKVKGVTYNLENGEVVEQRIDKADMVKDNITDNFSALKFNLPSMKVGSIVHFTYTLEYFTYKSIPNWFFQHNFPTLFSMYEAKLPQSSRFTDISRTNIPFEKVSKESELTDKVSAVYNVVYGGSKTDNTIWVRRNVPALKEEVFRAGENNYLEQVKVFIIGRYSSWNLTSKNIMETGNPISRIYNLNLFPNKKLKELTGEMKDELEKAKAIYSFVRDSFIFADYKKTDAYPGLKSIFDARKGNQREINQILLVMLLKADINAELVVLSLKPNEPLNSIYPDFGAIDYTITKVRINDKDYYLDPTEKYLPFGHLLTKCYNGYSRILSKKWREVYLDDNLLQDKIVVMANLKFDTVKHKMILTIDKKMNDVTAFNYRDKWMGDEKKAKKDLTAEFNNGNFQVENITVKNIADPDHDLFIHFEATADFTGEDKLYLNAYLDRLFKTNPLPSEERKYPIAFNYKFDYNYYFTLQLPDGYTIEYMPESKKFGLEQNAMLFTSLLTTNETKSALTLNSKFQTNKSTFEPIDYDNMRTLIETMLAEQDKNIILKKLN